MLNRYQPDLAYYVRSVPSRTSRNARCSAMHAASRASQSGKARLGPGSEPLLARQHRGPAPSPCATRPLQSWRTASLSTTQGSTGLQKIILTFPPSTHRCFSTHLQQPVAPADAFVSADGRVYLFALGAEGFLRQGSLGLISRHRTGASPGKHHRTGVSPRSLKAPLHTGRHCAPKCIKSHTEHRGQHATI